MGRCEPPPGLEPFGRLIAHSMPQEPYRSGQRVFWVVDNGSSQRGQAASQRRTLAYPNLSVVHTPVHASWLNQVDISFSSIQRKVLMPNACTNLAEVDVRRCLYEERSNSHSAPRKLRIQRIFSHGMLASKRSAPWEDCSLQAA